MAGHGPCLSPISVIAIIKAHIPRILPLARRSRIGSLSKISTQHLQAHAQELVRWNVTLTLEPNDRMKV